MVRDVVVLTYDTTNVEKYSSNIEEITMSDLVLVGRTRSLFAFYSALLKLLPFCFSGHRGIGVHRVAHYRTCAGGWVPCARVSPSKEYNELSDIDMASLG